MSSCSAKTKLLLATTNAKKNGVAMASGILIRKASPIAKPMTRYRTEEAATPPPNSGSTKEPDVRSVNAVMT